MNQFLLKFKKLSSSSLVINGYKNYSTTSAINSICNCYLNSSSSIINPNQNLFQNPNHQILTQIQRRKISTNLLNRNESSKLQSNHQNQNNRPINPIFGYNLEIDGQKLHYECSGHGQQILLLLPGALGTAKTDFLPQLTELDGQKFKIIAWDPPGYGQSRPPDRDFDDFYHKDAQMAAKLMKKLNYPKYSILGWSDGGITGIIMAAQNPSSIEKLIIWGSNAYVCEEDRELLRKVRDARKDWSEKMRKPLIEMYGEEYFYKLWDRFVSHYLTLDDICKRELKQIECPTLILHGDQDPMLAREHPIYLVNNIPNATLYRFPNGKHNIHLRYAKEFNQICEDFLLEDK